MKKDKDDTNLFLWTSTKFSNVLLLEVFCDWLQFAYIIIFFRVSNFVEFSDSQPVDLELLLKSEKIDH